MSPAPIVDGPRAGAETGGNLARTNKRAAAQTNTAWRRPVTGILLGGFSLVALLALASYRPNGKGLDWAGPIF